MDKNALLVGEDCFEALGREIEPEEERIVDVRGRGHNFAMLAGTEIR